MATVTRKEAVAQGLTRYFTGKPCKYGHVTERLVSNRKCVACAQAATKQWMAENPEKRLENRREYRVAYRAKNGERLRAQDRAYHAQNEVKTARRKRYHQDLEYRIATQLRSRLWTALRRGQGWKYESVTSLLGCSILEAKAHIEKQFMPGMSWDNWAHDGWHIDHIRPCASFDLTCHDQQRECFHYTNLQPLWAKDNREKWDCWEPATMAA